MTTLIVTHNGPAHRDEFLAIAVFMGMHDREHYSFTIERREPTAQELATESVCVIDVGGQYNPDVFNFDHHQDPNLPCAFTQVLEFLNCREEFEKTYGWAEVVDQLDRRGPYATATDLNVAIETFFKLLSPIEQSLLYMFSQQTVVEEWLVELMRKIGEDINHKFHEEEERQRLLKYRADIKTVRDNGNGYIVCLYHDISENPTFGVQRFRDEYYPKASVSITPDDRGDGYALYRFNDDPKIDFNKISDDPRITFAHANGFIAKTIGNLTEDDLYDLVSKSVV